MLISAQPKMRKKASSCSVTVHPGVHPYTATFRSFFIHYNIAERAPFFNYQNPKKKHIKPRCQQYPTSGLSKTLCIFRSSGLLHILRNQADAVALSCCLQFCLCKRERNITRKLPKASSISRKPITGAACARTRFLRRWPVFCNRTASRMPSETPSPSAATATPWVPSPAALRRRSMVSRRKSPRRPRTERPRSWWQCWNALRRDTRKDENHDGL